MPTYQAECKVCGFQFEYRSSVGRCMDTPACPSCNHETKKVILSAPLGFVTGKFDAFVSIVDGSVIRNQRELLAHNERNQVVNLQDGYDEATIMRGDYCKPDTPTRSKKDVTGDVLEAIRDVSSGYKPVKIEHDPTIDGEVQNG